jgi:hypothetical protein
MKFPGNTTKGRRPGQKALWAVPIVASGLRRKVLVDRQPFSARLLLEDDRLALGACRRLTVESKIRLDGMSEYGDGAGNLDILVTGTAGPHTKSVARFPQCPFGLIFRTRMKAAVEIVKYEGGGGRKCREVAITIMPAKGFDEAIRCGKHSLLLVFHP